MMNKKYFKFIAIVCIIYYITPSNSHLASKLESNEKSFHKRHLLSLKSEADKYKNCVKPDIEQFPKTFFSQNDRKHGAILVYLILAVYMFVALAIVCDEYFVPSLETICKAFGLKEDIAGATFMAAGSSAPELATTVISLFIAKVFFSSIFIFVYLKRLNFKDVDIGIGTVVGSAVFNIMFVISIVSLLSGMIICISWYPILRDSFFYLLSILAMILVIMDEKVYWYEALALLILYCVYILVMIFNSKIQSWVYSKSDLIAKTHLIEKDQFDINSYETMKNSTTMEMNKIPTSHTVCDNFDAQSQRDELDKQFDTNDFVENYSPFKLPTSELSLTEKIKFYICWPLLAILFLTVPDCRKTYWQKYFLLTFIMSLVWLSLFSYIMVWMITVIGYTFMIPDTIMGITFIAFGASVPDALSSLLVAKNGQGDMAVSNAIGSNVFDILVCLGIPWLVGSLTIPESYIVVKSKGLIYSTITLFGTVIVLILALRINKWQLDKTVGLFLMGVYFLFIILASLYEVNILGSIHLPMCKNSEW